jgi:hypothetical protein
LVTTEGDTEKVAATMREDPSQAAKISQMAKSNLFIGACIAIDRKEIGFSR